MKVFILGVLLVTMPSIAQEIVDAGTGDASTAALENVADAGASSQPAMAVVPPALQETRGAEVSAKFGEGATVKVKDFSLNVRGRVQTQAFVLIPNEGSGFTRQNALFVRRARLAIKGELPWHLSFTMQLAFANQDMEPDAPNVLRDFFVDFRPLRDFSVRFGQMKVPFDVQRVVSSSALQMVDRSIVTGELNLDRDVGIVMYSDDFLGFHQRFRYSLGVFGGDGRNRIGSNQGLLYVARLRFSLFGPFDDKIEGDPDQLDTLRVAIGGAVARNVLTNRPRSTLGIPYQGALFDYSHATADLHVKCKGASLLTEFFYRQADQSSQESVIKGVTVKEFSRSGLGWFAQGGYYVLPWLELTARYGDLRPTGDTDPAFKRTREIGGGLNFMFKKHDLKIQSDYFWLDDGTGKSGRHQVRVQAQVFF
jgi:phosphate-selective porin OprO and OprP